MSLSFENGKTNYIMAQEYTSISPYDLNFTAGVTGVMSTNGNADPITWRVQMFEYNDSTGNIGGKIGEASAVATGGGPNTLNLNFNNSAFTIASGNRVKYVIDAIIAEAGRVITHASAIVLIIHFSI